MFCSFKFTKKVFVVMYLFSDWSGCGRIRHSQSCNRSTSRQELEQGIQLPIIMYHGILKDTKRQENTSFLPNCWKAI